MNTEQAKRFYARADALVAMKEDDRKGIKRPAGFHSNRVIRARNGGVRHQFEDSIGGCSSNYR